MENSTETWTIDNIKQEIAGLERMLKEAGAPAPHAYLSIYSGGWYLYLTLDRNCPRIPVKSAASLSATFEAGRTAIREMAMGRVVGLQGPNEWSR